MSRVVVVGAGIAGLAAAYALQRAGIEVLVLEKANAVGGRMQTVSEQGFTWDAGAQFMLSDYRFMPRLMARLGVAFSTQPVPPLAATVLPDGRLHYVKAGSVAGVLRHPALALGSRARLAKLMWAAWRNRHRFDWYRPELVAPIDTESLRTWGDRVVGQDAVDWLLSPPTAAFFFWDAHETPWWYAAALAWAAATGRSRVQVPQGGMGAVPQALARYLDVRLGTTVQRVDVEPDGVVLLRTETGAGRATLEAERVILATPAPVTLSLLPDPEGILGTEEAAFLRSTRYTCNLTTAVAYDRQLESRAYGVHVPLASACALAAIGWEHVKDPGRVPPGNGLGVLMPTHRFSVQRWDAPDQEICAALSAEVQRFYPGGRAKPLFSRVRRWPHAMPVLYPGWSRAHARALAADKAAGRRVFTCGDYWLGPTTEQALVSGLRAALAVLRSLGRAGTLTDELALVS